MSTTWTWEGDPGYRDGWAGMGQISDGRWILAWTLEGCSRPECPDDVPVDWMNYPTCDVGAELFETREEAEAKLAFYREEFGWE